MEAQSQHGDSGDERRLDLQVPARPNAVGETRRALGQLPLAPSVLDDARLLVSELVANSVRHAGLHPADRIRVRAALSERCLRVDVIDEGHVRAEDGVAGAIRPTPGAQSGWGLYLVERLATRWGRAPGRYWFELELGPGPEG
jgi:anti-sigma regulatory factor (Ser/Thr protein kinase)